MIVQRVYLKGFLSYRDEAELRFDGAALWLLSGPNGAGKSAVFDAITFALYGQHRGGGKAVKELINKHADNMAVEVDFTVDGDAYRVRRTAGKRGGSSFQAYRLASEPLPIAETDSEAGMESWVRSTVGLDFDAFTASVLLRQGQGDALLQVDPKGRHIILSQIVDLVRYERLAERAAKHENTYRAEAELLAKQVTGIEPVAQSTLDALATQFERLDADRATAQQRREQIAGWKVAAEHWQRLQDEMARLKGKIDAARPLLAEADRVHSEAARHAELVHFSPLLERLHGERERLQASENVIAGLVLDERQGQDAHVRAQREAAKADALLRETREEHDRWQRALTSAQGRLAALARPLVELTQLEDIRKELRALELRLAQYPADLDARLTAAKGAASDLQTVDAAAPWLTHLQQAREGARSAAEERTQLLADAARIAGEIAIALSVHQSDEMALAAAQAAERAAGECLGREETLLESAQKRWEHFTAVDAQPLCDFCGQPLTPEHLAAERTRRESELAAAQDGLATAQRLLMEAQEILSNWQTASDASKKRLGDLQATGDKVQRRLDEVDHEARAALISGQRALENLPAALRQELGDAPDIARLCAVRHALTERRTLLLSAAAELDALDDQARERDGLSAQQTLLLAQEAPLVQRYPEGEIARLEGAHAAATDCAAEATQELARLAPELTHVEGEADKRHQEAKAAATAQQKAAQRLSEERVRHEELSRAVRGATDALPDGYRAMGEAIDEPGLQVLRNEMAALATAPERLGALRQAERDHAQWEQDLARNREECESVPPEARRPLHLLELDEHDAQQAWEDADAARTVVDGERNELLGRQTRRAELTARQSEAARQHGLYRTLADLLGRDGLQRHLLQQAERRIVEAANGVLDRVSSGTLRLALRTSTGGAAKALDLVAYQTVDGVETELGVAYLSGSQRFRVAVSLALGIGQYASADGHGVESVIIDEGFGSLDLEGRREMIDQFHALKDVLRRIVLVSHQEEFATAFSNGYRIWREGGTSHAALLDS